ncbi:Protein MxiA [Halomonadaceae bacterium LMG 33818]|uniref:type III secretion system export apparatus subunit SctV n=1 Tax=Cernens ardua TaxID=3402176 RepID=UPI003EDC9345
MGELSLKLNALLRNVGKRSELIAAGFVLAVVFMIIIPLPTWLLDALIAINICIACLMITISLFLPRPLAFSSFPSVLLLTTMFRLALSISATRLILLYADGGAVISSFGHFVVRGNLAVGLVIFLIIAVVNFLVITKGSERVAEVSARFTLDGMPGKQMSIESDLRAGLISQEQARAKRGELVKESQMFGAMDGALKFVKGDAIASLIIVAINLIAGLAIGMLQKGMPITEALAVYSVLSIGDGMVSQIPALLISLTAGMITTRIAQDEDGEEGASNVGRDVILQMSREPRAWFVAALGMVVFALIPGMPTIVFLFMSALAAVGGWYQYRHKAREMNQQEVLPPEIAPAENGFQDIKTFDLSRELLVQLPASYAGQEITAPIMQAIRKRRNLMVTSIGMVIPNLKVECTTALEEDELRFCIHEVPVMKATLTNTMVALRRGPLPVQPMSFTEGRADRGESHLIWVPQEDALVSHENVVVSTSEEMIVDRVEEVMFSNASRFFGMRETMIISKWLEMQKPELAQELQRLIPLARLCSIFQRLVNERIPLRATQLIAEALCEHGQYEKDVTALADYARIALRDQIFDYFQHDGVLNIHILNSETEELLRESLRQTQTGTFLQLEHEHALRLTNHLSKVFGASRRPKSVLMVAQDIRAPLRDLIAGDFNHVAVLSFAEISKVTPIEVVGRMDITKDEQAQSA